MGVWVVLSVLASGALQGGTDLTTPGADAVPGRLVRRDDGTQSFLGRITHATSQPWGPESAAAHARAAVTRVAGGLLARDLAVRSVEALQDAFVVHFEQRVGGQRVEGSFASALVDAQAVTFVTFRLRPAPLPTNRVELDAAAARKAAEDAFASRAARAQARDEVELVRHGDRLAYRVELDTQRPWGYRAVFIDAQDGALLSEQLLGGEAVSGDVTMTVDTWCQGEGTSQAGMPHIAWGTSRFADDGGRFFSDTNVNEAVVSLSSPHFQLVDQAAPLGGPWRFPLAPAPAANTLAITDVPLGQSTPFYHAHRVRGWLRARLDSENSQHAWTEESVRLTVNLPDTCNAYYDGSLNFFREGNGCRNTGRVSTIIYHEYGHGIHHHSSGPTFDGQVSEGIADFVGATINDNPRITGLFSCGSAFRTCDNKFTYCNSGCDFSPGSEVHVAGQVICGTLWELRDELMNAYGKDLGAATAERLFLRFLTLVGDMNSAYDAAIAADDDDDGNPANGTRHSCAINKAFADETPGATAHFPQLVGKIPGLPTVTVTHEAPGVVPLTPGTPPRLSFLVAETPGCAPSGTGLDVKLTYTVNGGPKQELTLTPGATEADGVRYEAVLDGITEPATIEYYVIARLGPVEFVYPFQGRNLPRNAQWPYYRQVARLGVDPAIYVNDFETEDPGIVVSGSGADGASDWERGTATGIAGEPTVAKSGTNVMGTDLGASGDGLYERGRTSTMSLPPLDIRGYEQVRLQYWRHLLSADVARIEVNGIRAYEQRAGAFFWRDPVWIFQDLDLTAYAKGEDELRIRFVMQDTFDDSFQLGGWTIDDVRVVARGKAAHPDDSSGDAENGGSTRVFGGCAASSAMELDAAFFFAACAAWFARRRWFVPRSP